MQQTESTYPGYFIAVDGGNGAGKSTAISTLVERLREDGHDVLITREPGGTSIGEKIRHLILDTGNSALCPMAELLLFAAARAQHFREKIEPALQEGKLVISDRFSAATVAFQGYAQGMNLGMIEAANQLAVGWYKPDLNVILDLDPAIGMQRMKGRATLDRHEIQELDFHQRARQGYLDQARSDRSRFLVVDASQAPEQVLEDVVSAVRLKLRNDGIEIPRVPQFLRSQESC